MAVFYRITKRIQLRMDNTGWKYLGGKVFPEWSPIRGPRGLFPHTSTQYLESSHNIIVSSIIKYFTCAMSISCYLFGLGFTKLRCGKAYLLHTFTLKMIEHSPSFSFFDLISSVSQRKKWNVTLWLPSNWSGNSVFPIGATQTCNLPGAITLLYHCTIWLTY